MEKPVDRAWEAIGPLAPVYVITKHPSELPVPLIYSLFIVSRVLTIIFW